MSRVEPESRVVRVRVLGPVEASVRGREVELRRRALQVLATLALQEGRVVPVERLVDLVWESDPPASARTQASIQVSALRRAFERAGASREVIETTAAGYRLNDRLVTTDLAEVAALIRSAGAGADHADAAVRLRAALDHWRGPVVAGLATAGLEGAVRHWDEVRLNACEQLYAHELALGHDRALVGELTALVADHPLRERLRAQLMTALWSSGRQADALAAYRAGRRLLRDELGLEPGAELRALHQAILSGPPASSPGPAAGGSGPAAGSGTAAGSGAEESENGAAHVIPAELPAAVPTFTGRDAELERLRSVLDPTRPDPRDDPTGPDPRDDPEPPDRSGHPGRSGPTVVAVEGPAGIGKSTLAVRAAHAVAEAYPDGQLYVDLRGSTPDAEPVDPGEALGRMLRSLGATDTSIRGVDEAAGRFRSLTGGRRVLIVLDNARDTAQIQPLLPANPRCSVLVTSRRILAELPGAVHEHLDVLSEPDAVRLLTRSVAPAPVDPDDAAEVVRLCGRLPLAIALAGARLIARPTATAGDLACSLRREAGRLDALQSGERGPRASFAVGYAELDAEQRRMFRALGLLDAEDMGVMLAAAVADVPVERAATLLDQLVDAQLARAVAPGRYALHDLLRLYARERATDEESNAERTTALLRALHCYLATARACLRITMPSAIWRTELEPRTLVYDGLEPADADEAYRWLDAERRALPLVARQAATLPGDEGPLLSSALCTVGAALLTRRGRGPDVARLGAIALESADRLADPAHAATGHESIGFGHLQAGDLEQAGRHLRLARAGYAAAGMTGREASQLHMIGIAEHRLGRYDAAIEEYREAIALARRAGRDEVVPLYLTGLALTYRHLGRHDEEVRLHTEALDLAEPLAQAAHLTSIRANLAEALRRAGRPGEARARFAALLDDRRGQATEVYIDAELVWGLGCAEHDRGELEAAGVAWRTAIRILSDLGLLGADERRRLDAQVAEGAKPDTPDPIARNT